MSGWSRDTQDLCSEHPRWDQRKADLYWTDITGRHTHRLRSDGSVELIQEGTEIAGFTLNEPGGFSVVNSQGAWLWDGAKNWQALMHGSFNDCIADAEGRLLAGSLYYDPSRADYPSGSLIRVSRDGQASVLDSGFRLANGLAFSPDNRTLYFADSAARVIFAYDYNLADGTVAGRRELARFRPENGVPDGLAIDAVGFIWCAFWFGSCILRLDPDGSIERRVELLVTQTSSLTFGGPDVTDLYVTTAAKPDALELAPAGYDAKVMDSGGRLYRANLGIPGLPANRTRIRI